MSLMPLRCFNKRLFSTLAKQVAPPQATFKFVDESSLVLGYKGEELRISAPNTRLNCCCDMCRISPGCAHRTTFGTQLATLDDFHIRYADRVSEDTVRVEWSDGHEGVLDIPRLMLKESCNNVSKPQAAKRVPWGGQFQPVQFDMQGILNEWATLRDMYEVFERDGIVRVMGGERHEDTLRVLAKRIGTYIYRTVYGDTFHVETVENPDNHAYSGLSLLMHTDLAYYDKVPDIFLFQCLENELPNQGECLYLDGLKVIQLIQAHHPEAYRPLCTHRMCFHDIQDEWHLYARHETIELGKDGNGDEFVKNITFNEATRNSLDKGQDMSKEVLGALQVFKQLTLRDDLKCKFWMTPGEITIFDNRRLLHGRNKISGKRVMHGCFLLRDSFDAMRNLTNIRCRAQ